jgi:parvulin-like peptidyl-prolyl isomerase
LPNIEEDKTKGATKPVTSTKKSSSGVKKEAEIKPKVVTSQKTIKAVTKPVSVMPVANDKSNLDEPKPAANETTVKPSQDLKGTIMMIMGIVIGVIVVVVVVFGVLIYGYKSDNPAVKAVASVIPYPVMRVNGHFVSYSDYLFEVDAENRAYESNAKLNNQPAPDFNSASGKKLEVQIKQHALTKLESDALVAQLASQKGIQVTNQQVQGPINQLYKQYGGEATLLKTLNQIYGWNLSDLKGVVRKQLLAQDLQNKVTSDPTLSAASKAKAESIHTQINGGADFSTLAKKDSQAQDASNGGNMGYFTKTQVPADLYNAAEALQAGQVSNVIQDQYGFVILKVIDKKSDGSIDAQEILIETVDYNSYFQNQLNEAKVNTYIKV